MLHFNKLSRFYLVERRQIIYLDGHYPRPHDPAAVDPEVLVDERSQQQSFSYFPSSFFDNDFFIGSFSNIHQKIASYEKNTREKREVKNLVTQNKEKEGKKASSNTKKLFSGDWSHKLNNTEQIETKDKHNDTLSDHHPSSSRFRPLRRNFRRHPEHNQNRYRPRYRFDRRGSFPRSGNRRDFRESQQFSNPESSRSRKFSFPGSGSPEFLSQFTTLFNKDQRKSKHKSSEHPQKKKQSNTVSLGSGNFDILPGGIYPDNDGSYENLSKYSTSNRNYLQRRPDPTNFDGRRYFYDRYFNRGDFSEKHDVTLKADVDKIIKKDLDEKKKGKSK